MDTGAALTALHDVLLSLERTTNELAEVRKAENIAYHENFSGNNVTEARENAKQAASAFYRDSLDLQADIDNLLRWRDYWTLRIEKGI